MKLLVKVRGLQNSGFNNEHLSTSMDEIFPAGGVPGMSQESPTAVEFNI